MRYKIKLCAFILLTSLPLLSQEDKPTQIQINPLSSLPDAQRQASLAMLRQDWEVALPLLEKALAQNPQDPKLLTNAGSVALELKNYPLAEKYLHQAIGMDPRIGHTHTVLGLLYFRQEKWDLALSSLARATHEAPKDPQAHHYLGLVLKEKKWINGAEMELQKSLSLAPKDPNIHFNLALLYLDRTPPSKELAQRHYEKALSLGAAKDALIEKILKK